MSAALMPVRVIGISHRTAPLEIREQFVFPDAEIDTLLDQIIGAGHAAEAVLLSTCNRTELYYVSHGGETAVRDLMVRLLSERASISAARAQALLYEEHERAAVEHLFRVSASLDSMILGEPQIQGQVRSAYEVACAGHNGSRRVGPVLSRLFETALSVGGRVRSQTGLGTGAASVPSAAVDLARKIFGSLRGRTAAILGTGEMSKIALECLQRDGVREATMISRTDYDQIPALLGTMDIIVTATAAPHAVLTSAAARSALPRGRKHPLLIVDIALPRDVEPAVGEIENVFLYNLDDLQQVVDSTIAKRRGELPIAEAIVGEAAADFWQWYRVLDVVPLIRELREHAETIRQQEVERALRALKHLSQEDAAAVDALTRQILNKVLHAPTVRLKEAARQPGDYGVLRMMRYLLGLGPKEEEANGK
ncbi:MAG: glutamyl-tRNA reductase [Gemmatimonadota bacterium]